MKPGEKQCYASLQITQNIKFVYTLNSGIAWTMATPAPPITAPVSSLRRSAPHSAHMSFITVGWGHPGENRITAFLGIKTSPTCNKQLDQWWTPVDSYLNKKLSDFANIGAPHLAHFALLVFEREEKTTGS